ncbi:hypothetical protein FJV80_05525 [Mesorhizobium sp. WSM4310]|nr:hypothetical protein FJV80_05525 [Mesorhizobium sp. WSM4310]
MEDEKASSRCSCGVYRRSGRCCASSQRYSSYGPIDTAIFVVFLVFFWWLISDFSGSKGEIDANEAASVEETIGFRFGRSLSRIFRRG